MVKAGEPTDAVIDELAPLLDEGDIVVDAGNAHFVDTIRRENALSDKGIHFVGMGVSGGEEGALNGPSIMVGGSDHAYERLAPVVESIAAQVDGTPCATHVGPDGAGHFVKMVHNGIEYADMQLIAESFDLLRSVAGLEPAEIADVFREWNDGDLESFLIEITADVLRAHRRRDRASRSSTSSSTQAEQKGTGALDRAERARPRRPGHRHRRGGLRPQPVGPPRAARRGAHGLRGPATSRRPQRRAIERRRRSSMTCAPRSTPPRSSPTRRASTRSSPARASTAGTSTSARSRRSGAAAASSAPSSSTASATRTTTEPDLDDAADRALLRRRRHGRRGGAGAGSSSRRRSGGIPTPGVLLVARLLRRASARDRLPAALIQALRDNFGAHTYRRVDRDGAFHTLWSGDLSESSAG